MVRRKAQARRVAAALSHPSTRGELKAGAYGETRVGPIVCVKYKDSLLHISRDAGGTAMSSHVTPHSHASGMSTCGVARNTPAVRSEAHDLVDPAARHKDTDTVGQRLQAIEVYSRADANDRRQHAGRV